MTKIEVIFPRFIFPDKSYRVNIPESWNELSTNQLTAITALLHSGMTDIYRFRIHAIKIIFGFHWHEIFQLSDRMVDLFPFVKFIEESNNLTENKYESLKIKGKHFYGPIGNFETLKADEWTEADQHFIDYCTTKEPASLDSLVAVLFRPKNKNLRLNDPFFKNDWREPFNEHTVASRAALFQKLDNAVKFGILTWYQGCRSEWEGLFDRVFKGNEQQVQSFGWMETIQKLSGSTFGSLEQTEKTYMYKLMLNMEITLKDDEFRKEQEHHQKLVKRNK